MVRRLASFLACALALGAAGARAQTGPSAPTAPRAAIPAPVEIAFARASRVAVLARLRDAADLPRLAALDGVEVAEVNGRPLRFGRWIAARVTREGAAALAPQVERLAASPPALPPLDRTAERLGLPAARGARGRVELNTGAGVRVADVDSHVDVFHPDFFNADAGWYDWIDVDGDGRFTEHADAIDLDGDGIADPEETARVLRAGPLDFSTFREALGVRASGFDPSVDWVYLDLDGDGARSFGAARGFTDADPAFGEPLFVPDDVDLDGQLDPEERLVRLGTSKFERVLLYIDRGMGDTRVELVRGVDLATSPSNPASGAHGYSDELHATGVLGILAGGVPLPSRRWVGVAPDATLLNAGSFAEDTGAALLWTFDQRPDVALHEYVLWTRTELDGSDAASSLIDEAAELGVVNVCPTGNIGAADKHAQVELAAGETAAMDFRIGSGVTFLDGALYAVGPGTLTAELVHPSGAVYDLSEGATRMVTLPDGGEVWSAGYTTTRGTQQVSVIVIDPVRFGGGWQLRVSTHGGPLTVHGMLADEYGFARSSVFEDATPASTIAAPSTADRCVAVGAVPAHEASEGAFYTGGPEAFDELRAYSARGPRIDGEPRPHVVAPDNPWSALPHGDIYPVMPGAFVAEHGAYNVFGGTSGAGPHVAGLAALLVETGLRGEDVHAALTGSAIPVGAAPNDDAGFGRISAAGALGGTPGGRPPAIRFTTTRPVAGVGERVTIVIEATDPDGDAVEVRLDQGYDGTWDTEYLSERVLSIATTELGVVRLRARARDATGLVADAAIAIEVVESPPPPPDPPTMMMEGGCGCRAGGRGGDGLLLLPSLVLVVARPRRRKR